MDLDAQAAGPKVEGTGFVATFGPYEVKRFLIAEPAQPAAVSRVIERRPATTPSSVRSSTHGSIGLRSARRAPASRANSSALRRSGSPGRRHGDAHGIREVARQLADGVDAVLARMKMSTARCRPALAGTCRGRPGRRPRA